MIPTPPQPIAPRLLARGGMVLLSVGLAAIVILGGVRPDLGAAMVGPVTAMKWLLPLAVALSSLLAALALTRPQVRHAPAAWGAAVIAGLAAVWLVFALVTTPADSLWPTMLGKTALVCLGSVIGISIPTLAVTLAVLRDGASPNPIRSGALAGLTVGGFAAAIYALHCNQDQPLFFLTWYGLGMLIVCAAGALAGWRLLRW